MQTSLPLPASVPSCGAGHHPQIVTTTGAPVGHRLGAPCPALFHIECHACGVATVPSPERAMAELRWTRDDTPAYRIPISHLARHRALVLDDLIREAELASLMRTETMAPRSFSHQPVTRRSSVHGRTTLAR